MIRIYIENNDITGYNEGCSCCSSEQSAELNDILKLMQNIKKQYDELDMLVGLVKKYGKDKVVYFYRVYENLRELKSAVEGGHKYAENKKIEGTYWKECYKNLDSNIAKLNDATREYKKTPALFRKYMESVNK